MEDASLIEIEGFGEIKYLEEWELVIKEGPWTEEPLLFRMPKVEAKRI